MLQYCLTNNISFDLLISIEGGYEQVGDYYFIVTYASILDTHGKEYFGKSQGLQITESMFNWVKSGKSLNKVIEEILATSDNKKANGISGFLTSGYYYRSYFDYTAIVSAIQYMQNTSKTYDLIDKKLQLKNGNHPLLITKE